MNTDIRISTEFPTHPKTIMLMNLLGLEAVWSLICLWVFAAKHRPNGVLRGLTPDALRIACGYPGDMSKFLRVLKQPETQFLDHDTPDGWIVLHDWEDHNPWAFNAPERSIKAKISAFIKHGKYAEAEALRNALQAGCATHAKRSKKRTAPSPILSSPSPKPKGISTGGMCSLDPEQQSYFDTFWTECPRKVKKPAAVKAWASINPDKSLFEAIIVALKVHRETDQWKREKGKFIPYPSTWLNDRRWEDEVGSVKQSDPGLGNLNARRDPGL